MLPLSDNPVGNGAAMERIDKNDMEHYYRMVIDLCKNALASPQRQVSAEESLQALTKIECALTAARLKGEPTEALQLLKADVEQLRNGCCNG